MNKLKSDELSITKSQNKFVVRDVSDTALRC